ncbi:hypothetical protein D3C78_1916280 [compost metagenome]
MHDISVEMRGKTLFEIISLYQVQEQLLVSKSLEYMQALEDKNETAKNRNKEEYDHLEKEKCVIALHIADELSKVSKK